MKQIISFSLPDAARGALELEAKRQGRSRSAVAADAILEYAARQRDQAFQDASDRTLSQGLKLSPAERVQLSEQLWEEFARGRHPAKPWVASFDTFDDYNAWQIRLGTE